MLKRLFVLTVVITLILSACAATGASDVGQPTQTASPPPVPTEAPASVTPAARPPRRPQANLSEHAGQAQANVTYCTVEGVELKMNIYSPKESTGATPLLYISMVAGGAMAAKTAAPECRTRRP